MNARLEQLLSQSFTDEQGEQFDAERFAQLIIEECIREVKGMAITGTGSPEWNQAIDTTVIHLHDYFEVTE